MSYLDRYVQGQFRGLRFFTRDATIRGGQRRAIFEIPFDSAGAASIDLGRKPRRYKITALLLERPSGTQDLDVQVKAFLAALEQPGPGLLVHPYLGNVMVLPDDSVSVHLSTAEGGLAEIEFEAVESRSPAAQTPTVQTDTRASLPKATAQLRVANAQAFEHNFKLKGVADFVRSANSATLGTVLQNLRLANGAISAVLSIPGAFASQIDAVEDEVASLLDTPDRLYSSIAGAVELVYQGLRNVASKFGSDVSPDSGDIARPDAVSVSVRSLKLAIQGSNLTAGSPPAGQRDTPPRAQERINRAAMDQAMQAAALAAIADSANELELPSSADNTAVRDLLLDAIENLLLQELDSAVVDALEDLRAETRARFTGGTALTEFTPGNDMPADVIAWQLYGDAERAPEIVARNALPDPGDVPAFTVLEVLVQ